VAPRLALIAGVAVLAIVGLVALLGGGEDTPVPVEPDVVPSPAGTSFERFEDPFSYDPVKRAKFEARATAGNAHVLYALSPGGAEATAERVARLRPAIEDAAKGADVSVAMVEALVFLESGGRPDAVAPAGTEGAAGLTQIVASTATSLLGMHVDIPASKRIGRKIARATRQAKADRLLRERAKVDDRFDPLKALAGTGRYLKLAEERFGSEELAFVSYHMGIGNLESVLSAYAGGRETKGLRYAQVYFDSSPVSHPEAYRKLYSLGDDSSNYLWKLRAAREIMRLYRRDPEELRAVAAEQTAKNSAEEVLHPAADTPAYATPQDLAEAYDAGDIVALPVDTTKSGLRLDPRMGELARKVGAKPALYRGLRPEALAMALYIGAEVRAEADDPASALTLTSGVRDEAYQRELVKTNFQATRNFSLHTTGWAFDVLRRYRSPKQALAFQSVLDRLTSLNLIAWVREPTAIHITVSGDAAALKPLLSRIRRP
jgi:soluble lytic murein transglycosylase-like protein